MLSSIKILITILIVPFILFSKEEENSIKKKRMASSQVSKFQNIIDSNIVNNTNLDVSLIFEQPTFDERIIHLGESLFDKAQICVDSKSIVLKYGYSLIVVHEDNIELIARSNFDCISELTSINYTTNREYEELPDGEFKIKYIKKEVNHQTSLGELTVHIKQLKCDDTGMNPITLKRDEGDLVISNIDNIQFFEYDINQDGKNELYILSYASCEGYLKIYKIQEQM
jgi:hypothetical protein